MTGEHDYDITVQPFVCRRCLVSMDEARATADPRLCVIPDGWWRAINGPTNWQPMETKPVPRHAADDYGAIAERLKDLGYQKWITE